MKVELIESQTNVSSSKIREDNYLIIRIIIQKK